MKHVVPSNLHQLPAKPVAKPYKALDEFTEDAKRLTLAYLSLERVMDDIYPHCPSDPLKLAEMLLDSYDRYDRKLAGRLELAHSEFEPDDAYDENGYITKSQVAKHVSLLVGSFPNANPADPEVYTMMLIEEIGAAEPSVIVLETACRNIRRSAKFLPAISEVLDALKEAKKTWSKRWLAIECMDETAEELRSKLTAENERRTQEKIQREKRKTACPFAVGDRVGHQKFGVGTVSAVDGNKCTVQFANHFEPKAVVSEFLDQLSFETGITKETSQ